MGSLIKSIVAGLVGGAVGAAIWALIAYQAHVELGWIAWGVGVLVGLGVRLGAAGDTGPATGLIAAVIAAASVAGGKYATIMVLADDATAAVNSEIDQLSDEAIFGFLVDEVVVEFEAQGRKLDWPEGMNIELAREEADYPKDVWAEAKARWERADEAWRNEYRQYARAKLKHEFQQVVGELRDQTFLESFEVIDIVFFLFAVISAYGIGAGIEGGD